MKRQLLLVGIVIMLAAMLAAYAAADEKLLTMSTTTSTQASGLLDVLLPAFKADTGVSVKVIAKGTGAAIRDGMDGNVDLIFVHAKAREKQFVREGYGTRRFPIMHNDFVILGPAADPAGIRGTREVSQTLQKIAGAGAPFISRGDDSGTHTKEQQLWQASGLPLKTASQTIVKKGTNRKISFSHPDGLGRWYFSIGQGMGKALTFAEEKQAYILSDRGTYIKFRYGKKPALDLEVLCEGDPRLANPYGVIPVNPAKFPHVKHALAEQFARWLSAERGQGLIARYRLEGQQLFYPDALPDVK
ncbi:MAG: substrate-binding domain-containing protein [Desulfobacterales bacterium]|nr:substrate-binding domain-containing protein [Desulfobacterales bacterium]